MAFSLKSKACFFIFLLAGNEAARIKSVTDFAAAGKARDPGSDWQAANDACTWSTYNMGCVGPTPAACSFRYLPLDNLPPISSESCRLTNNHMLTTDRTKYFQLQAQVLAEKSEKFAENCKDANIMNLKCKRRAKHMFRAITFMSEAQDESLFRGTESLSEEQKQEDKLLFQQSLDHIAQFAGPDAHLVLMLKDKVTANKAGVKKKPLESVQEVMRLLTMLLQGNYEEREEARQAITDMSSEEVPDTISDEEAQDEASAHYAEIAQALEDSMPSVREELSQQLGDLDDENGESEQVLQTVQVHTANNASALMQQQEQAVALLGVDDVAVVKGIAFVAMIILVVCAIVWAVAEVLAAMVTWVLLSLLGCGVYTLVKDKVQKTQAMTWGGWLGCTGKVFSLPFVLAYKGTKKAHRFFFPKADKKTDGEATTQLLQVAAKSEAFPNFPCTEDGANELMGKYKTARVDATNGPSDIEQLLTTDAYYTIPMLGTYKGRESVVNDYLKKNPAKLGNNYRNDAIQPVTITKAGEAAQGTMTFDAHKIWWHNGMTATISLKCRSSGFWKISSIVVA